MKRFHVNVSVKNLSESIRFYTALFAAEPSVLKGDYAKWMLEDPFINFAISQRGHLPGINHLGFQVESAEDLTAMHDQLTRADEGLVEQSNEACCYAKSDKYWVTDPEGIAWETFHTLNSIPIYGDDTVMAPTDSACCAPKKVTASITCCETNAVTAAGEPYCAE